MEAMFRFAGAEVVETYLEAAECWGVARGSWSTIRPGIAEPSFVKQRRIWGEIREDAASA